MEEKVNKDIPIARLNYDKNDLIIREGDYGVSIYYILNGKVEVYTQTEESVTTLAILESGDIFGEMVFLYGSKHPRSASVRAIEPTELEVYHSARFLEEYRNISPILKYITDQALKDLLKINKKVANIDSKLRDISAKDPWSVSRRYFRKDTDLDCFYKPIHSGDEAAMGGKIVDISKGGLKMHIKGVNTNMFPHRKGTAFSIAIPTSNDEQFTVDARIVDLDELRDSELLALRMAFLKLSKESLKKLGFLLM